MKIPGFANTVLKLRPVPAAVAVAASISIGYGTAAQAQGSLENPQSSGFESGIGLVSGWHCNAGVVEVQFNDLPPIAAAYGTSRLDTEGVCGDSDNGWGLLFNYNLLGDGQHTVRVLADGAPFGTADFTVTTLGQEFITGLNLSAETTSLTLEKEVEVGWQQSKQGFVITRVEDADISLDLIIATLSGDWSGFWNAPNGDGTISVTFAEAASGAGLELTRATVTNTGCAQNTTAGDVLNSIDDPIFELPLADGSELELEFIVTESFTALGGSFLLDSGPCEGTDGIFYLFRQ